jgi:glycosyltransferase involved in cell wall biosynthesis
MTHKLALALIVKGDDKEAELLARCLNNLEDYVDGIFVTVTQPNKAVEKVCKEFNAHLSHFEWCKDFAKARNFNFSQVPKEYDYIMWTDADDQWRGLEKLREVIEENKHTDAFAFWYLYDFDEYKQATVVHKKTMIVRNDGCVEWMGALHEDFKENRSIETKFIEGIERLHLTTHERVEIAQKRNVEVSKQDNELNPNDPRTLWNLGNSYLGAGMSKEAQETFEQFIKQSDSREEKYLAHLRLADVYKTMDIRDNAIENLYIAIGMRPDAPDAYTQLGFYFFEYGDYNMAEFYTLNGLMKKPPYHSMIVYNPRDYDYNPMMLLSKIYFLKNRPDLALPMLEGCLKIYPKNEQLRGYVDEMKKELGRMNEVVKELSELHRIEDKGKLRKALNKVPKDLQSHPAICAIRNENFVKTESSGKDLVYYCGSTEHQWNPDLFKEKGFGGSEEAVINLSKEFAKSGWNVTVYNNCGSDVMVRDGVTYRPFWEFNTRDKQDVVILWRSPKAVDHNINASKIYIDLHDVIPQGEFTEKRLEKIDKIFVKTNFHRSLFPNVLDGKFAIIPNGMDFGLFDQDIKKDQYLLVNTSSPDRSMDVLPKLFKEVKKRVPQARLKWAYGWAIFDQTFSTDAKKMAWRDKINADMEDAGVENLGRLSQAECAKLYLEGNILAFPTEFAEIDCITVKKAQACGCMPITTDFGALNESVQHGIKIHSDKTKDNWCKYQFSFGLEDEKAQKEWVMVEQLQKPLDDRQERMVEEI